jgi:hypothetical protein
VRNSGWYIPFWRKPKRAQNAAGAEEKPEKERRRRAKARSDEDLERVRDEWVQRYTRRVQASRLLGLSVGAPQDEINARYQQLVAAVGNSPDAGERLRALYEAYLALHQPE